MNIAERAKISISSMPERDKVVDKNFNIFFLTRSILKISLTYCYMNEFDIFLKFGLNGPKQA